MSASSSAWVVGCGSLKFSVGLMSLWVSQVHRDSLKLGGVGWVLNWCGSWWIGVQIAAVEIVFFFW